MLVGGWLACLIVRPSTLLLKTRRRHLPRVVVSSIYVAIGLWPQLSCKPEYSHPSASLTKRLLSLVLFVIARRLWRARTRGATARVCSASLRLLTIPRRPPPPAKSVRASCPGNGALPAGRDTLAERAIRELALRILRLAAANGKSTLVNCK